ncbi:MAG: hypothetical protein WCW56_03560 [Candidatus Paceibacterota bacterium]|jgi:hypothetical protein
MKHWSKILILAGLFLLGSTVAYFWSPNYLANILLVYTLPVLLNLWWLKKTKWRILIFSLITTLLFALPIELLSRLADSWDVATTLPRLWGLIPLENMLFAFINFVWVLAFYEYFIDGETRPRLGRRAVQLLALYLTFFILTVGSFLLFNSRLFGLSYWAVGLLILFLPAVLIFRRRPGLLKKTVLPTIFFALIFFIHEMISMKLGHWWWPGQYLLPTHFLGQTFPLDDVIIWYLLSTPALIGGYEFFIDDYR